MGHQESFICLVQTWVLKSPFSFTDAVLIVNAAMQSPVPQSVTPFCAMMDFMSWQTYGAPRPAWVPEDVSALKGPSPAPEEP